MDLIIREAVVADAEAMTALVQSIAQEPGLVVSDSDTPPSGTPEQTQTMIDAKRDEIRRLGDSERSLILLAESDGEVVGELMLIGDRPGLARGTVGLDINVKAGHRNQGVGSALLERGIEWARSAPEVTRVLLNVIVTNAAAIHLYEKFGFIVEGEPFTAPGFTPRPATRLVKMVLHI